MPYDIRHTPDAFVDNAAQVGQVIIHDPAVDDGASSDDHVIDATDALKDLPHRRFVGDIRRDGAHLAEFTLRLRQLLLRTPGNGDVSAFLTCQLRGCKANPGTATNHHDMRTL